MNLELIETTVDLIEMGAVLPCDIVKCLRSAIESTLRQQTPPAAPVQEPVSMRMPKVGDKVVCLDDESLGTVVYLTAGGSPEIKFDDGSHGTYMLREFAELFGYTTPPAAPVQESKVADELPKGFVPLQRTDGQLVYAACMDSNARHYKWLMRKHPDGHWVSERKLEDWEVMQVEDQDHYGIIQEAETTPPAAQRQWVDLTDEAIQQVFIANSVMVDNGNAYMVAGLRAVNIGRAIEAKLKENT